MGAWGYGSDENDDTYDALGGSIQDRAEGLEIAPEGLAEVSQILNDELLPEADGIAWLGVAIWGLRQGLTIRLETLQDIKKAMISERAALHEAMEEEKQAPSTGRQRAQDKWLIGRSAALLQELEEVESALTNGGRSQIQRRSRSLFDKLADTLQKKKTEQDETE